MSPKRIGPKYSDGCYTDAEHEKHKAISLDVPTIDFLRRFPEVKRLEAENARLREEVDKRDKAKPEWVVLPQRIAALERAVEEIRSAFHTTADSVHFQQAVRVILSRVQQPRPISGMPTPEVHALLKSALSEPAPTMPSEQELEQMILAVFKRGKALRTIQDFAPELARFVLDLARKGWKETK